MAMFEWNGGIKLLGKPIWFDGVRYDEISVITSARVKNAHRHKRSVCTDKTFYLLRTFGPAFECLKLPYGVWVEVGGLRLSLHPSGFMPGSSVALGETGDKRFLFVNRIVLDAIFYEKAVVPNADILVVVTPYGSSEFSFGTRKDIYDTIADGARDSIMSGQNPVFLTSAIGKAQEVTNVLSVSGFEVVVHRSIARVCEAFKAMGVDSGRWKVFRGRLAPSQVLIYPDHLRQSRAIENLENPKLIWLSGMAKDKRAREVFRAHEGICLSGYPDISALLKLVVLSSAKMVYLVGDRIDEAVMVLRKKGVETNPIRWEKQLTFF
jgi:putative mRNA 3-end processing factor